MAEMLTKLADGIPGSEGPVLDQNGWLYFVSPDLGAIYYFDEQGQKRELANTGGIPAGLQVTQSNALWVADMKLGVFRVSPEGELEHTIARFEGQPMRGCNDCSLDSAGNLYLTAPAGSSLDEPTGEVFCRTVDGQVHRLDGGYAFSNGIAVSADDKLLIVAETFSKKLWAYDITAPGKVQNKRLFGTLPGDHTGGPDGLDFDVDGNLLAANWGGSAIEVFDPQGQHIDQIELPFQRPSNVHFGGGDGQDLYITEHTHMGLWRTRWHRPGLIRFPPG